jgi:hypothetical protein
MPEIINCPSCQRKLQVPESLIGQDVQCPTCGATFTASLAGPTPSSAPAPPPQPAGYGLERGPSERREPPRRPRTDDYDDYDEREEYGDRPRRRRRDLLPHRGSTILTLGILGLVVCGPLGIIAWVMGNQDLAEMRAGRMDPEGEGTTNAGRICGIIATVFMIIGLVFACLWFFVVMAAIGQHNPRPFR